KKASQYKMPAVAMTDKGNMFGAVDFYQSAVNASLKPIVGADIYLLFHGSMQEKNPQHKGDIGTLVLYARNQQGYQNLLKIISAGYLQGFYYTPRMDKEFLFKHSDGLLCLSDNARGEIGRHLLMGNFNAALKSADEFRQVFGRENFYLEIMDHGLEEEKKVNDGFLEISKQLNIPLVVTNDVHYLEQDQAGAHEVLWCIQRQTTLDDPKRVRLRTDQYYFKTVEQMKKEFAWVPEGLSNTIAIMEKCDLKMDFDQIHLPRFDPPDQKTKEDYFNELCEEGLIRRYGDTPTQEVRDRLTHEIQTIEKMGFVSYFLIVWDFINYAKSQGIPVGPGRGSAAGSLVSYLLGITDLDPLKYDLLFERFLNPDRAGMPDIDIDFCYERRGEVIDYVTRKYGAQNVAQIITFGSMQARAAIRDVGRVLGASYGEVDKIAKLVPNELGITIDKALEKEPQLEKLCEEDKMASRIIETARVLEGLNRHASTHAAGVVISDKSLNEYVPLYQQSDGSITTGFFFFFVAKIGLLKMDFLGLRTLTVISKAVNIIARTKGVELDMGNVPLDDQKTYENLSQANSFGVFQLESSGMRELLKKLKPSVFEDLIAVLALYRPGPMGSGMLDDFIQRKRGDVDIKYEHNALEPILKETYGIMVYQEQVMKTPVALAGFSLVQADHLRRAMSKKIVSVMAQMRKDFVEGCQKVSHMTSEKANYLFDLIDYFSGYGFNKSHSAAYAFITYQTAYLKANYPVEFMTALLTCEKDNTEKVVEYVKECDHMGLTVVRPNVNKCFKEFRVVDEQTILYGLLAVKNVGGSAIDSIVENRKDGPYKTLYDFCERVDLRLVNRKVIESLIKCGAMDDFKVYRSQLMKILERAMELGAK
ncbi:MAG: DNA polymerase III subunit alpha, partial [Candidatus Omnitrophica bacterium]|nr:DNA polymerase III subunit alpha [Candidatus Omnitrophota bacterium]